MILYFDENGFHERIEEAQPNHYVSSTEEQREVAAELNRRADENGNDVWRIAPDETGKPIVKQIPQDKAQILRRKRKRVFSIVNRGPAWYNTLSNIQKEQLDTWYRAWLDAPSTLIEPTDPSWLK